MIKHNWFINREGKKRYICNQAVEPLEKKLAKNSNEVTCKNCLDMCRSDVGDDERKY